MTRLLAIFALAAQMASASTLTVTWQDRSTNETGFRIERREGSGSWLAIAVTAQNATSYDDTTVEGGKTYTYRVIAFNSVGMVPENAPVSEPAVAPLDPALPTAAGFVRVSVPPVPGHLGAISTRAENVGPAPLIGGFVVVGSTPARILIRGVGPGLAQFGISNPLPDPGLQLIGGPSNEDWGGSQELIDAFASVDLFALAPNSKDAAMIVTLPPGSYTVHVTAKPGQTGVALVEVYQLTDVP